MPAFGCIVEDASGKIAYSGDTRACPAAVALAERAQLFVCEATLREDTPAEFLQSQLSAHMTARQAGELAENAGARRLVLTHLMYYLDPKTSVAEAKRAFKGEVEAAAPGKRWRVGRGVN